MNGHKCPNTMTILTTLNPMGYSYPIFGPESVTRMPIKPWECLVKIIPIFSKIYW